jgi:hypothetical protein
MADDDLAPAEHAGLHPACAQLGERYDSFQALSAH